MNIKYIALLSLTVGAGVNAMTTAEKLDQAKKEFNQCRQSTFQRPCDAEEQAFFDAREEFLAPLYKNTEEGKRALAEYNQEIKEAEKSFFSDDAKETAYNKYKDAMLKGYASTVMTGVFTTGTHLLDTNATALESFDLLCDAAIDKIILPQGSGPSFHKDVELVKEALKQQVRAQ